MWGHSETPQDLTPLTLNAESSYRILANIHEPLVGMTSDLQLSNDLNAQQQALAKDWSIGD